MKQLQVLATGLVLLTGSMLLTDCEATMMVRERPQVEKSEPKGAPG